MRKAIKWGVSLRQVQEVLGCPEPVASSGLGKLQRVGQRFQMAIQVAYIAEHTGKLAKQGEAITTCDQR
jgi:hypothetical protein